MLLPKNYEQVDKRNAASVLNIVRLESTRKDNSFKFKSPVKAVRSSNIAPLKRTDEVRIEEGKQKVSIMMP